MKTYEQLTKFEKDFLKLAKNYLVSFEKITVQYEKIKLCVTQSQTQESYIYLLEEINAMDNIKLIYTEEVKL